MDLLTLEQALGQDSLFAGRLLLTDTLPSTNTRLAELARNNTPEGTVLLAEEQSGGRGTQGRSFFSPRGEGLYLSLLLRPSCPLEQLLTLTGRTAAAVRQGIEDASGAPCAIKWLNDIYLNDRKLCGILTEFSPADPWVVIGIGVNVSQNAAALEGQGLGGIATSLATEGYPVSREILAAAILRRMEEMYRSFPQGLEQAVEHYRSRCITLGRSVSFPQNGQTCEGVAVDVAEDFTLTVQTDHGLQQVSAGAVTLL